MKYNKIQTISGIILFVFVCLLSVKIFLGFRESDIHDGVMENVHENQSGEDNGDEDVEPFIDEELYRYIKGVYEEIDWDIQFLQGDESKRDFYREQFIKLLKEEIPVVDEERGYETTLSHFGEIKWDTNYPEYAPEHYNYFFYDVDGDGTPELGMTNSQRFVYIFKYEEETDRVVVWDEYIGGIALIGTSKFQWLGGWGGSGLMGLDQNGDYIFLARFKVMGSSKYEIDDDEGWGYFVALPEYVETEDWMMAQATYFDADECYYFRVTKEQYDELEGRYLEALHESYREKEEITYTYDELLELLSEEEKHFLEEHIYGQWRFANRIVEIDDNNHNRQGVTANISDVGVEELKRTVVIDYEERYVDYAVRIGQNTFTYAQDMYLFAAHGGFSWTRKPIYKINEMGTDRIVLKDVYNWAYRYEVEMPGWEDYIHVSYATEDQDSMQFGHRFSLFGSNIYVNPDDTDTIYIDFCGLWEMTRDDTNYSTNGKYFGPG